MLTARSGQQKISTAFLLEIGWVQLRTGGVRQFPRPEEVELVQIESLKERYTEYLDLMKVNPRGLAERIFYGETKWVERVVASLV